MTVARARRARRAPTRSQGWRCTPGPRRRHGRRRRAPGRTPRRARPDRRAPRRRTPPPRCGGPIVALAALAQILRTLSFEPLVEYGRSRSLRPGGLMHPPPVHLADIVGPLVSALVFVA